MDRKLLTRIAGENRKMMNGLPKGISIKQREDNICHFDAWIEGPIGSPFEGGIFHCELFLGDTYPLVPPKALMKTKIYHPNFDKIGRICLDVLKDAWTPVMNIESTILSIQSLMAEPCLNDPLDTAIAQHYINDLQGAHQRAREWTNLYAKQ